MKERRSVTNVVDKKNWDPHVRPFPLLLSTMSGSQVVTKGLYGKHTIREGTPERCLHVRIQVLSAGSRVPDIRSNIWKRFLLGSGHWSRPGFEDRRQKSQVFGCLRVVGVDTLTWKRTTKEEQRDHKEVYNKRETSLSVPRPRLVFHTTGR